MDVLSTIDLGRMAEFHKEQGALATLAVEQRESSRALLFDADGQLCGRRAGRGMEPQGARETTARETTARETTARETTGAQELAFAGIHVISPKIFKRMSEEGAFSISERGPFSISEKGAFSIIDAYLKLAAEGEKIAAFRVDGCAWRDVGRPESLKAAEQEMKFGKFAAP